MIFLRLYFMCVENRDRFGELDGIDVILQQLSVRKFEIFYRKNFVIERF